MLRPCNTSSMTNDNGGRFALASCFIASMQRPELGQKRGIWVPIRGIARSPARPRPAAPQDSAPQLLRQVPAPGPTASFVRAVQPGPVTPLARREERPWR